jgi:integrase
MTAGLEARAAAEAGWPPLDTPILRHRTVRAGSSTDGGLFGDPVWRLTAAHPDAHTAPMHIRWKHFPPRMAGLTPRQRLEEYLRQARSSGQPLPGHDNGGGLTVNYSHLARILGFGKGGGYQPWRPAWKKLVCDAGLPVGAGSYLGAITGRISGQPWRGQPVTVAELAPLARLLGAAAFTAICYLSGMRPGEVLNLRRGCAGTDEATGELLVTGRPGKGHDRQPEPGAGGDPGRPWVVVQPVHTAIAVLEAIVPGDLLFPASITRPGCRRASTAHARSTTDMNQDIEDFIAWVNATFTGPAATPLIPPDPAGRIFSTRFRRTLAYFIVRRPGGLIAAALQYGHVHSRVTLGYAGAADTGWLDDLTVERLEMVLEQADTDWRHLAGGEHVSGPAASDYRTRIQAARPFAGRAVTSIRAAERLLAAADLSIHHGEAMTCGGGLRPPRAAIRDCSRACQSAMPLNRRNASHRAATSPIPTAT